MSFVATSTLYRNENRTDLYRRDLDIETEVTVGFHLMGNHFQINLVPKSIIINDVFIIRFVDKGTTRVAQASKKFTERRLNWYGHVMRSDGEHILRKVLRADIPGKRKRERPKTRCKDASQRDL